MDDLKEATPAAWREYESEKAKARKEGLSPEQGVSYIHISECARQKRKTAGGYHWKAADLR